MNWIHDNFYIPETRDDPDLRGRLILQPYQIDALNEALSKDEDGNYKYSIIIWSDVKKSIKSTIAAAVNLYIMNNTDWGETYVIANDLKQADSRVAMYMRRAIELSPTLRKFHKSAGYSITNTVTRSHAEAIPIDPSGEAGSNADMITFSELWGANEIAKARMWSEMTLSPTKFGKSFRWVESYAGFAEESLLLWQLWETGVKNGELVFPDRLYNVTGGEPSQLELYKNEAARMLCLWNTQPRNPWQTPEYYASEAGVLLPNEFLRMHRNQWVTSEETFVPAEWYDACKRADDIWPKIDPLRTPIVVSADAAVSDDTFGVWAGFRHPDHPTDVCTLYARRWKPPEGRRGIDFVGTKEKPGPEMILRDFFTQYNVVSFVYDPYQLHDMASRFRRDGVVWARSFGQQSERLLADSQFRDIIRDRRFWHRGEPDMREHVLNANAKVDPEDRKVRMVKRSELLKIDLGVAASMGSFEVLRLNL